MSIIDVTDVSNRLNETTERIKERKTMIYDFNIHVEKKADMWTGYVEMDGARHYPAKSKTLAKFLYGCVRVIVDHLTG